MNYGIKRPQQEKKTIPVRDYGRNRLQSGDRPSLDTMVDKSKARVEVESHLDQPLDDL